MSPARPAETLEIACPGIYVNEVKNTQSSTSDIPTPGIVSSGMFSFDRPIDSICINQE